ncbi:futalosine hydrolase [Candidatus Electronema sp. TJ]|uniref:futalosine hydrolase n=1 Tax=Candidatus Electronema sp. TJ TaxID=3401573 RepID=UPI003AA9864B
MSILIAAATEIELRAFDSAGGPEQVLRLLTGIGPVETAHALTAMLCRNAGRQISAVINFGIAGAFPDSSAALLDICLAEQEILGDLGLCLPERIERLAERGLTVKDSFVLDDGLRRAAAQTLRQAGLACKTGTFVTVSCASGTAERAQRLGRQFQGLCENMEGAAAARVCEAFHLPCVELRCVSNIAGERDRRRWRLHEACLRAGQAAALAAAALKERLPHPSALQEQKLISRF